MRIELSEELLSRLSSISGLENISAIVHKAQKGDHQAISQLKGLTLPLSTRKMWDQWPGPEDMADIVETVSQELAKFEQTQTPARLQQPSYSSLPNANLQSIGSLFSGISIPYNRQISPESSDRIADALKNSQSFGPNPDHPKWRVLAKEACFPTDKLTKTEQEILTLVERVLIRGQGWGPKDGTRGQRTTLTLIPTQLSKKGLKRTPRTYQRAIKRLIDLGLLRLVEIRLDGIRNCSCSWWQGVNTNSPVQVWQMAAKKQGELWPQMSHCRRNDVARMSDDCRTDVAHPVIHNNPVTPNDCNTIGIGRVRHLPGRNTSDIYILTGRPGYHPSAFI